MEHDHIKFTLLLNQVFDGEEWEIRTDISMLVPGTGKHVDYGDPYCAHINCTFGHWEDQYSGLWSWELDDPIESDNGLPWCHYCHGTVPEELQAIVALLGR